MNFWDFIFHDFNHQQLVAYCVPEVDPCAKFQLPGTQQWVPSLRLPSSQCVNVGESLKLVSQILIYKMGCKTALYKILARINWYKPMHFLVSLALSMSLNKKPKLKVLLLQKSAPGQVSEDKKVFWGPKWAQVTGNVGKLRFMGLSRGQLGARVSGPLESLLPLPLFLNYEIWATAERLHLHNFCKSHSLVRHSFLKRLGWQWVVREKACLPDQEPRRWMGMRTGTGTGLSLVTPSWTLTTTLVGKDLTLTSKPRWGSIPCLVMLCFTALSRRCIFYKLKVCSDLASSKSLGIIFTTTYALFTCWLSSWYFKLFHYYHIGSDPWSVMMTHWKLTWLTFMAINVF